MAEGKKLGIYRVEYETAKAVWKAYVGGYSSEESINYLRSKIGAINVTTVGYECSLDAITDELRSIIVKNSMPDRKGPGRPKKEIK